MKGLITTSLIIAVLIAVGIGTSLIIASDLSDKLAAAHQRGYEEGRTQGYLVGFKDGSRVGYQEGGKVGYERGNEEDYTSSNETGFYFVYNPTCDEVQEILAEIGKASVKEIHDYTEANGIRAAYVRIRFKEWAHALVAFQTVDGGLVFIEPQSDEDVRIEVGEPYLWWLAGAAGTTRYDDTVVEIQIIW